MSDLQTQVEQLSKSIDKLPPSRQSFAIKLCADFRRYGALFENKARWVGELLRIAEAPADERPTVDVGSMAGVIALFDKALQHLKQPKIVLALENGEEFRLSIAGERAHAPGSINVTDLGRYPNNQWFGRVYRDGRFEPSPRVDLPDGLVALLERFAGEPARVASEHGRATGRCCFCNSPLTDARSTAVGFGPVCADRWALKAEWKAADSVFATAA
jgi:hypothetical protein